ncbi:hypothetical protein HYV74_00860 [Candidatus Uhrbacteria bacterium]|nr:hypothetical protein [Candidatus Uhrbacteria bacterium]
MNRYQWTWVGTYLLAPLLICSGVASAAGTTVAAFRQSELLTMLVTFAIGCGVSIAVIAFGLHGIRQGRLELAGDHWRREDFE